MTDAIAGVVRLRLADVESFRTGVAPEVRTIARAVPVEVDLGDGWPDQRDVSALRLFAWRLEGPLTVVGNDLGAVAYVVDYLRKTCAPDIPAGRHLQPVTD